jgi:asparagine synthetase B (glutamine-hydrolysing)
MNLKNILKFNFKDSVDSFFYLDGYIYNHDISKLTADEFFHKIKNENFLSHVSGEYFLVVWNRHDKELILARDKIGIKPLFYTQVGSSVYISKSMKSLFHAGVRLTTNKKYLKNIERDNFSFHAETPWNEIKKIPPSNYALLSSKGGALKSYWNVLNKSDSSRIQPAELLHTIIEERARAQKSIGIFLSSGFDSTALCFLAERSAEKCDVSLYSLDFKSEVASESQKLDNILSLLKFKSSKLFYEDVSNENLLPYSNEEHAFIYYNPGLMLFKPLFESAALEGKKVVWTGLGGDDIFTNYSSRMSKLFSRSKILWLAIFYLKNILLFRSSRRYYFTFSFLKNALKIKSQHRFRLLEKLQFSSGLTFGIETEQHLADVFGMEMSYPLLDDRLIQCYAHFLENNNSPANLGSKPFLRDLMSGILPEFLRTAQSSQNYEPLWRDYLVKNKKSLFEGAPDLKSDSPLAHYYKNLHNYYLKQVESVSLRSGTL